MSLSKFKVFGLLLATVLALASVSLFTAKPVHAVAGDSTSTFWGNATTVGTVITGIPASGTTPAKRLIIKEIVITAASSGAIVLQEDPASGSNTTFGQVGLLANTPYHVLPSMLQTGVSGTDGYVTATGSGFQIVSQNAVSNVVSVWVRYAVN